MLWGERCSLEEILRRVDAGDEEASDPLGIADEEYLDLDELSRTFNHSCAPNAYIRGMSELVALRDIAKGEEITYDYSTTMDDNEKKIVQAGRVLWTCECHCGSADCRGEIDQFKMLPVKLRRFYLEHAFAPDFILKKYGKRATASVH
jgi:hypothetical protein